MPAEKMELVTVDVQELEEIICAVRDGFVYDPGHSDLDDEQPINVRMMLGQYRKACRLAQ